MKITLITPTYNGAKTLPQALDSILLQKYPELEHIIVDGNSNDATMCILDEYKTKNPDAIIISERDQSLYEAINKGVRISTGEIIGILHSDDEFSSPDILSLVAKHMKEELHAACYGDLLIVDRNNPSIIKRNWDAGEFNINKMRGGWCPPHTTLFVRKDAYELVGPYRTDLPIASDYEFMFRLMSLPGVTMRHIPKIFVHMKHGGLSSKNIKHRIQGWKDLRTSWKINGKKVPSFFITRRILSKIAQYYLPTKKRP